MKKITIVTAYFDCKRGYRAEQKRTDNEYIEYFKFWARMKNEMVIYPEKRFEEAIYNVRKAYGLEDKTRVVIIDNIYKIEEGLYAQMKQVEANSKFVQWRYRNNDISNEADYDYIMLMKYWCMADAVKYCENETTIAWIDFGWNHGGQKFVSSEEFSYEWNYDFSDKIQLYSLTDPKSDTGIIRLQQMTDSIMGANIICPDKMCARLYAYVLEAMESLLSLDCYDDDQMLLRMAYKRHTEDFEVNISDWFLPLKEYGGAHLTVRVEESKETVPILKRVRNKLYKIMHGKSQADREFEERLLGVYEAENRSGRI